MKGACIVDDQRERCVCLWLCAYVYMCVCVYICHIKMEVCVFMCVHMCIYMPHKNGSVCLCECVRMCVYICVCVCVCTPSQAYFYPCRMECWPSCVNTDAIACRQDWASRVAVRQLAPSASCSAHDWVGNIVPREKRLLLSWQILLPSPLETEGLYVQNLEIKHVDLLSYEFIICL